MTSAEFLSWEREQPERHEFFAGEVFLMAGGSPRHNALVASVTAALFSAHRHGVCRVLSADQRIGLPGGNDYVYADVSVVCGPMRLQPGTSDVFENPTLVAEVLSKRTESYDRGLKWDGYQRIVSLRDYLLVSQQRARVEHFQREADGTWRYRVAEAGQTVILTSGAKLEVDELFAGVFDLGSDEA
jgi:Uma2 family endonuclease